MQDDISNDWPGKADGVPRPPTSAELNDISAQQGLITDEWAPAPLNGQARPPKPQHDTTET